MNASIEELARLALPARIVAERRTGNRVSSDTQLARIHTIALLNRSQRGAVSVPESSTVTERSPN